MNFNERNDEWSELEVCGFAFVHSKGSKSQLTSHSRLSFAGWEDEGGELQLSAQIQLFLFAID